MSLKALLHNLIFLALAKSAREQISIQSSFGKGAHQEVVVDDSVTWVVSRVTKSNISVERKCTTGQTRTASLQDIQERPS